MIFTENEILKKLFRQKTDEDLIQFFRYFLVAVLSAGIDLSLLYILTEWAGLYYKIAAGISYILGMLVNYILSILWVFDKNRFGDEHSMGFAIFLSIGLIGLGVTLFLMWLFVDILSLYYMLSRCISMGIGYFWKYFARKYIIFDTKK